jgi:hypothetical protein
MTGGGGRAATVAAMVMEMFFVAVCVHYHVKSENDCESTVRVRGRKMIVMAMTTDISNSKCLYE